MTVYASSGFTKSTVTAGSRNLVSKLANDRTLPLPRGDPNLAIGPGLECPILVRLLIVRLA